MKAREVFKKIETKPAGWCARDIPALKSMIPGDIRNDAVIWFDGREVLRISMLTCAQLRNPFLVRTGLSEDMRALQRLIKFNINHPVN